MSNRRPTIIDVANRAGVSKSTVSLVLQQSDRVKVQTQEKVYQAIRDLGYVYNRSAANMRTGKTSLIGVIINDIRNPFFSEFAASFQDELAKSGYLAVLANSDENPKQQANLVRAMIQHSVSALVISPAYGDLEGCFDDLISAQIPMIQVMRQVDQRTEHFPFIAPDYYQGGKRATEQLIRQGATRIAFVGGLPERPVTLERRSGYLTVMAENSLSPILYHGRSDRAFGKEAVKELSRKYQNLDAVLCFNDFVALGFSSGVQEQEQDQEKFLFGKIKIIGFDDIDEVQQATSPISSVRCDIQALATETASALVDRLTVGDMPWRIKRTGVRFIYRT